MKFISILIIFVSCTDVNMTYKASISKRVIDDENLNYAIDFREFSEKGFFFTSEAYNGDYTSMGMVDVSKYEWAVLQAKDLKPPLDLKELQKETFEDLDDFYSKYEWIEMPLSRRIILKEVYDNSVEMGADAIMNLKLSTIEKTITFGSFKQYAEQDGKIKQYPNSTFPMTKKIKGLRITGFAIKRH